MYREKLYLVHGFMRSINREINRNVCGKAGFRNMNSSMMTVLCRIMDEPEMSLKELSSTVGLANSTVSGIIDKLVEEGLVERIIDNTDRRRILITASQKALNIRKEIAERYTDYIRDVFQCASEEDIKTILEGLSRFNELIKGCEAS